MTIFKGDIARLERYVQDMAQRVGLRDWTITVSPDPCEDDANASINLTYGRKRATIRFHRDWANETPEDLRITVIHELLHCHVNRVNWSLHNVKEVLGKTLYESTYESMRDWIELAVDGMASEWAQHLPLPTTRKTA